MNDQKLSTILNDCQIMVVNAKNDPTISATLSAYGYTAEKLQFGVDLSNETTELFNIQKKEYTEQYYATNAFLSAFDEARKDFKNNAKIAQLAFRNNIEGQRLIPVPINILNYGEWKTKALAFYSGVLASEILMTEMAKFAISTRKLQQELASCTAIELLSQKRYIELGEAQTATDNRNKKLEELREYCFDLRTVAKIALANNPQQLEKLGILARSSKARKSKTDTISPVPEPNK